MPNSHLVKSVSIHIHAIMAGARIPTYTVLKTTPGTAAYRKLLYPPLVGNMGARAVARAESDDQPSDQQLPGPESSESPVRGRHDHLLTWVWPNLRQVLGFL